MKLIPLFVAAAMALAMPAFAQGKAEDKVVATVNGQKIMLSELQAVYDGLPEQLKQYSFQQLYRPILEQAIAARLVATEGRRLKLQEDPDVKRRLAAVEEQLIQQAYLARVATEKITEAKLKEAYDVFAKAYKGEEEVRASHILVKTEKEAREIIAELDKGGDFDKIGQARAAGPGKAQFGDLGFFVKEQMVKPFADAAFALKKGEYSKSPVQTQFGWHVIKVTDKRTKPAPAFDEVKDQLRQQLAQSVHQEEISRLRDGAKIERFNADGSPLKDEEKKDEKK